MIGKLMRSEGMGTALVVALCGTIAFMTANGPGRASFARVLSGALSNPVPRPEAPAIPERAAA